MAPKRKFGDIGSQDYAGNIIKQALKMNATGETAQPTGTTDGTATRKPYTGKELAQRQSRTYTAEEISANPYLSTLKGALSTMSYEQALANYRKLTSVTNKIPMGDGFTDPTKKYQYQKAFAALTPQQKYAENILFAMGGSLQSTNPKYGGYGMGTPDASLYRRLGLTPPTTNYAPVSYTPSGPNLAMRLANPLSATQRSRLQRLRGMAPSSLSARQKAALTRLRAKKNAPTILP